MSAATSTGSSGSFAAFGRILTFGTAVLAVLWAIIQYLFPDPMLYLYSIWQPEYVLVFITVFIFVLSTTIFCWSYVRHKLIFFTSSLFIYSLSCFAFFIMGKEYQSTNFVDGLSNTTAEGGALYHKGVKFSHRGCIQQGDTITCMVSVINNRDKRTLRPSSWLLVMEDGAMFSDCDIYRGGQKMKGYGNNQLILPTGADAQLEIAFYNVPDKYHEILSLEFELGGKELAYQNINIQR